MLGNITKSKAMSRVESNLKKKQQQQKFNIFNILIPSSWMRKIDDSSYYGSPSF